MISKAAMRIYKRLKKILIDYFGVFSHDVYTERSLKELLGTDPLNLFEFVLWCEREFNMSIPENEVKYFYTLGDIQNYILTNS